jgi:hypothetical protein
VQALAGIVLEKCLASGLIVPGFVACAGFHGGEDVREVGMDSTCFEDFLNTGFLSESFDLSDEIDFNAVFPGNVFGIFPDHVPESLGKLWVVKHHDLVYKQKLYHPFVVAVAEQCALKNYAVMT